MINDKEYFEFREEPELPEDLDYEHTKLCPHCKKPIPRNATICLYCGGTVYPEENKRKWAVWAALFIIAAFLLLIIFG